MARVPNMVVTLSADISRFSSNMKRASGGLAKFGVVAKQAWLLVAAGIGAAAYAFGKFIGDALKGGSDLQQSIGGIESVFKRFSTKMTQYSQDAAEAVGLSMQEYNNAAILMGTLLKNSGIRLKRLASNTNKMIELAADLAATYGGTTADAVTAMSSAFRGEFEPIRRFGIKLSVAEVQARALKDSHKTLVSELTKSEKTLATQKILFEQGADAVGQWTREEQTLAHQQQVFDANWKNLSDTIGLVLLPVAADFFKKMNKWFKSDEGKKYIDDLIAKFQEFADWILSPQGQGAIDDLIENIKVLGEGVKIVVDGIKEMLILFGRVDKQRPGLGRFGNGNRNSNDNSTPGGNPSAPGGPRPGMRSGTKASNVVINFNTPVDSVSAGREVARVLDSYSRANGRR